MTHTEPNEPQIGAPGAPPDPVESQPVPTPLVASPQASDAPARRRRRPQPAHLALAVVAVIAGTTLFLSGYTLGARIATTPGTPAGREALFAPFWDAYGAITQQYVGTLDEQKLVQGAIDGMVKSLGDPYSQYLTPEAYRNSLQGLAGRFEGIGAQMSARSTAGGDVTCTTLGPDCRLTVVAPIPDSPAEKAGLTAGDVVTAIDGVPVDGLTLDVATGKVRGPKGTVVTLTIVRAGAAPFDLAIIRDVIRRPEVVTRDLAGGTVGYIQLAGFSDGSAADFSVAVKGYVGRGVKKLVVDVRGNPGGYVTAARMIASQFIASGPIYWQENAKGAAVAAMAQAGGAATDLSVQVVVLIDRVSASASEIVAGALQDAKRATLVGERSFGKGTIQEWLPLPDDTGGIRLTIAKWLTPNRRWINGTGLTPDIAVTPGSGGAGHDAALDRALEVLGAPAPATAAP